MILACPQLEESACVTRRASAAKAPPPAVEFENMSTLSEDSTAWEAQLVRRVALGDHAAFGALYDRYAKPLYSFVIRILKDRREAEDVLQEVFLKIWEKAPSFDEAVGKPFNWAATMVRNKAIDRLRAHQRVRVFEDTTDCIAVAGPAEESHPFENGERVPAGYLRAAVKELPDDQRQPIELAFFGDFTHVEIPRALEKENDYVMLSDIFPTGWHATELAGVKPGESVVIYGCGPVGLMAAHSAMIKGASQVFIVDSQPDRLALGKEIGAIPIDYSKGTAVKQILELTNGEGADRGCECVGYQCHDPAGHEVPIATINDLVKSVRATGGIGVVGVFVPADPKCPDKLGKEGKIAFDFGLFWSKGQKVGTGQANVKAYNRYLCELIHAGRATPSWIVSHELALEEAPDAYKHFDARDDGWTKVILHPAGVAKSAKRSAPLKKTARKETLSAH